MIWFKARVASLLKQIIKVRNKHFQVNDIWIDEHHSDQERSCDIYNCPLTSTKMELSKIFADRQNPKTRTVLSLLKFIIVIFPGDHEYGKHAG